MQKPIRILHVLATLDRGGIETLLMNIYRYIDCSIMQFDFVIHTNKKCDYEEEVRKLGGKIYRFPRYIGTNHFIYSKAWSVFYDNHTEYKIVHGHIRSTATIYLNIAKKKGLVTIAHSHNTASRGKTIERYFKNIAQIPIRYIADYLFACSDEAGRWLFGEKAVKKSNYIILKNAIDIDKYKFNETQRNKVRKDLGIENNFVIGHVGSFTQPKNHKFLIDIFYQYQLKDSSAILLLVGDGELKTKLVSQIGALGIMDKVKFTGSVPNVNDFAQAMDVFVFPSLFEGLSLAILEAQASGLPCVVSDSITSESCVTNLVSTLSLQDSTETWLDEIKKHRNRKNRDEDICVNMKVHGYDISDNAEWLSNFYLRVLENNM